jgi:NADH dehydrogenase
MASECTLFLIGFRNRATVVWQWAWSYRTYERAARLITGELGTLSIPSTIKAERAETLESEDENRPVHQRSA